MRSSILWIYHYYDTYNLYYSIAMVGHSLPPSKDNDDDHDTLHETRTKGNAYEIEMCIKYMYIIN